MCAVPVQGLRKKDLTDRVLTMIQRGMRSRIPTGFDYFDRTTPEATQAMKHLIEKYKPTKWLRHTLTGRHTRQLGTLGGGNHFVELVYDEAGKIWLMLHSGSRNIGNVTAQHYDEVAAKQCRGKTEALAFLTLDSSEGQDYIRDMLYCQAYAATNRRFMMDAFATSV